MSVLCIIGLYLFIGVIVACVFAKFELRKAKANPESFDGIIIEKTYVDRFDPELEVNPDGFIAVMFGYPILIAGIIIVEFIKFLYKVIVR